MVVTSFLEMLSLSLIIPILGLILNSEKIPYIDALNNFGIAHYSNETLFTYLLLFFLFLYLLIQFMEDFIINFKDLHL